MITVLQRTLNSFLSPSIKFKCNRPSWSSCAVEAVSVENERINFHYSLNPKIQNARLPCVLWILQSRAIFNSLLILMKLCTTRRTFSTSESALRPPVLPWRCQSRDSSGCKLWMEIKKLSPSDIVLLYNQNLITIIKRNVRESVGRIQRRFLTLGRRLPSSLGDRIFVIHILWKCHLLDKMHTWIKKQIVLLQYEDNLGCFRHKLYANLWRPLFIHFSSLTYDFAHIRHQARHELTSNIWRTCEM